MPEKNAKATPENQSRTSTIIGFLIQGVFFIGLIGLSFWVQITSQAQKDAEQQTRILQTQLKAYQANQEHWVQSLEGLIAQKKLPIPGQSLDNWTQIRACIQMSDYTLIFFHNPEEAITWLQLAANIASTQIQTPEATKLVEKIDIIIKQLATLHIPSKQETLQKLQNLAQSIHQASQLDKNSQPDLTIQKDPERSWSDVFSSQYWHIQLTNYLEKIWKILTNSIQITQLSPEEKWTYSPRGLSELKLSNKLLIEQAQWSVLYNDRAIFEIALTNLAKSIAQKLQHHPSKAQLISDIKDILQQTKIDIQYPNYSNLVYFVTSQIESLQSTHTPYKSDNAKTTTQERPSNLPPQTLTQT